MTPRRVVRSASVMPFFCHQRSTARNCVQRRPSVAALRPLADAPRHVAVRYCCRADHTVSPSATEPTDTGSSLGRPSSSSKCQPLAGRPTAAARGRGCRLRWSGRAAGGTCGSLRLVTSSAIGSSEVLVCEQSMRNRKRSTELQCQWSAIETAAASNLLVRWGIASS